MLWSRADAFIVPVLALSLSFISNKHVLLMKSVFVHLRMLSSVLWVKEDFLKILKFLRSFVLTTKAQSFAERGFDANWGWQKLSFIWLNCLRMWRSYLIFSLRFRAASFLTEWYKDSGYMHVLFLSLMLLTLAGHIFQYWMKRISIRYALEIFVLHHSS